MNGDTRMHDPEQLKRYDIKSFNNKHIKLSLVAL